MTKVLTSRLAESVPRGLGLLSTIALAFAQPTLRVALALPFLRSGMTRWDGFMNLAPTTTFLFEEQFRLHIFRSEYAIPFPDQVALLTACAEITLPILLLAGLATRFSALGLLAMTGVIQLVMPDGWQNFHLYWAAMALAIVAVGPGPLALDQVVGRGVTS